MAGNRGDAPRRMFRSLAPIRCKERNANLGGKGPTGNDRAGRCGAAWACYRSFPRRRRRPSRRWASSPSHGLDETAQFLMEKRKPDPRQAFSSVGPALAGAIRRPVPALTQHVVVESPIFRLQPPRQCQQLLYTDVAPPEAAQERPQVVGDLERAERFRSSDRRSYCFGSPSLVRPGARPTWPAGFRIGLRRPDRGGCVVASI